MEEVQYYKTVKINEENDLALEAENGAYVNANILSQGTIDELYLSLRISSINELTKETMPIILDETFSSLFSSKYANVSSNIIGIFSFVSSFILDILSDKYNCSIVPTLKTSAFT